MNQLLCTPSNIYWGRGKERKELVEEEKGRTECNNCMEMHEDVASN